MTGEQVGSRRRLAACVAAWPEAETGGYDPRCRRFPKSCSADVYDDERVTDADLEPVSPPVSAPGADRVPDREAMVRALDALLLDKVDFWNDHPADAPEAVMAFLEQRYILVLREGATESPEWGVRIDSRFSDGGRIFWTGRDGFGRREPDGGEQEARDWVMGRPGDVHLVRRQHVQGPVEEVTP